MLNAGKTLLEPAGTGMFRYRPHIMTVDDMQSKATIVSPGKLDLLSIREGCTRLRHPHVMTRKFVAVRTASGIRPFGEINTLRSITMASIIGKRKPCTATR